MNTDPYSILEQRIRTGEYRPGVWLAPERRLAEELGVNRGTIRRVIARLASAGLVECRPGRRPVVCGPDVSPGSPATVALMMGNEPLYHSFQQVVHGCEPVLRSEGFRLVFMDTWAESSAAGCDREVEALQSIVEHPVSGLILWSHHPDVTSPTLLSLQAGGLPIVTIDRDVPGLDTDYVGIDNVEAAGMAVDHLLSLGHRRIAFATREEDSSPVRDREAGYLRALNRIGLPACPSRIIRFAYEDTEETIERGIATLLAGTERPTAVFALNDILALRLAQALERAGLRIPEDMAVVGFDDLGTFSFSPIGLTSVHQSYRTMGRQAARLICRRIKNPSAPVQHVLMETRLVVRASTLPEAGSRTTLSETAPYAIGTP